MLPQPLQAMEARWAQATSHEPARMSQQVGSAVQTIEQHAASEQPAEWCGMKQLPLAVEQSALISGLLLSAQVARAASTQVKSQLTEQQKLSM